MFAQQPGRPITIIVPYSPGTGIDILARSIATTCRSASASRSWSTTSTGASGNIGTGMAARAAPDGNTLLMIAKVFVVNPSLFKSVPYDPVKSFDADHQARDRLDRAGGASLGAGERRRRSSSQYAKARRRAQINYGSPGFATPHHLAMELFKQATGTNLAHVPYKGTSGVMTDLVGNHVSAMFIPTHVALPHARDKQIRVLGVASLERVAGSAGRADAARTGRGRASRSISGSGCWRRPARRPDIVRATTRRSTRFICARRRWSRSSPSRDWWRPAARPTCCAT